MPRSVLGRAGFATLLLATVGGLTMSRALPALASGPALPSGESMWALLCGDAPVAQLAQVSPMTGAVTVRGEDDAQTSGCAADASWDAASGTAYFEDGDPAGTVYTINLATGQSTLAFTPTLNNVALTDYEMSAIAISPTGAGYALIQPDSGSLELAQLDLTTGALDVEGPIDPSNVLPLDQSSINSMAFDPLTGDLYALSTGTGTVFQFNLVTGAATLVGTVDIGPNGIAQAGGLQFDAAGRLWFTNFPLQQKDALMSAVLPGTGSTSEPDESGELVLSPANVESSFALLITPASAGQTPATPKPSLAITGVVPVPGELTALLLLAVGSALLITTRRHRRAQSSLPKDVE